MVTRELLIPFQPIMCKCGSFDYTVKRRQNKVGAYCNVCKKFIRWIPKNEINYYKQIYGETVVEYSIKSKG